MPEYLPPVSEKFDADISAYVAKLEEMKRAQQGLADTSAKTSMSMSGDAKDVEKSVDHLGATVDKTTTDMGRDIDDTGRKTSDFKRLLTDNLRDGETAFQSLQRTIADTRARVTQLRTDLRTTGNASLFGDLKGAESDLKKLDGFLKDMGGDAENAGSAVSKALKASSGGLDFGPAGVALKVALIAGAATAAPFVLAALSGVVMAALGGGVIAAAVAEWRNNPVIKSQFQAIGSEFSDALKTATADLGPALSAGLADFHNELDDIGPELRATFDKIQPAIAPLIDGFGRFITNMLPGLEKGIGAAEPILMDLSRELPWLGKQVGDAFDDMSKGIAGARMGFGELITVVGLFAHGLGKAFEIGSDLFLSFDQQIVHFEHGVADVMGFMSHIPGSGVSQDMADKLYKLANAEQTMIDKAKQGPDAFVPLNNSLLTLKGIEQQLRQAMQTATTALDNQISKTEQLADSNLAMHVALTNFNTEVKKGTKYWNINTAAGQANRQLLYSATEAITANYKAQEDNNTLTLKGAESYLKSEQNLYKQAKAAGASKDALQPLSDTINDLQGYISGLKSKKVTITVDEKYKTHFITEGTPPSGFFHGLASGGVVRAASGLNSGILPPSDPGTLMVLAGEERTRGEVFMPLAGISRERAMSLAQVVGNSYDFTVQPNGGSGDLARLLGAASTAPSAPPIVINNTITLDGKVVHQNQIQTSQRYKMRTGTTGLT